MNTWSKNIIIVGAGGHARVVIDAAENVGLNILGILDIEYKNQNENILGYDVLGDFSVIERYDCKDVMVMIAIGDNKLRSQYFYRALKLGFFLPAIIHPTAIISKHAYLGMGVFVNAGVIINAKADIHDNTIINTGSVIDHEVFIGKHCHIGPGVKIAGRVQIGDYAFVGIGASVIDKITIEENVIIGAGSVIIENIESNSTVVGIPGKKVK